MKLKVPTPPLESNLMGYFSFLRWVVFWGLMAVVRAGPAPPTPESVAFAMLTNIRENGFDPDPRIMGCQDGGYFAGDEFVW
jgi:hypothetical protein